MSKEASSKNLCCQHLERKHHQRRQQGYQQQKGVSKTKDANISRISRNGSSNGWKPSNSRLASVRKDVCKSMDNTNSKYVRLL